MKNYLEEMDDRNDRRSGDEFKRTKPLGLDSDSIAAKDYERTYNEGAQTATFALANIDKFSEEGNILSPRQIETAKAAAVGAAFVEAEKSWLQRGIARRKAEASMSDPSRFR